MTIISHRHKFIFVRPPKTASTSIIVSLAPLCGDDDVFYTGPSGDEMYLDLNNRYSSLLRNAHIFDDLTVAETRQTTHLLPGVIRKRVGDSVWNEYFKFTVVRNPWDWFVSLYWWKMDFWREVESLPVQVSSPKEWPKAGYYYARRQWTQAWQRYQASKPVNKGAIERALKGNWFKERISMFPEFYFLDGRPYADCYIRFENLQPDFDAMRQSLRLPAEPLPKARASIRPQGSGYREYYTDWSREYIARKCGRVIDAFDYCF